jgi:hypothetical protein
VAARGLTLLKSEPQHKKRRRRVRYKHPNYPGQTRLGTVLFHGKDGCVVENDETKLEERVRHEDIVQEAGLEPDAPDAVADDGDGDGAGGDFGKAFDYGAPLALLKGNSRSRSESPTRMKAAATRVQLRLGKTMPSKASMQGASKDLGKPPTPPVTTPDETLPIWAIQRRLPYDSGHHVQYQRPDMAVPEMGKIESAGRHGAWVSSANGGRRKVRWEHVQGPAQPHVNPQEHGDAIMGLKQAGVPVDEADAMMVPGATEDRPSATLLERVKALASDGAPIDQKRAPEMSASAVRRAIERFTGPLPQEDPEAPEKPKKGAKPEPLRPWREDADEE